MKSKKTKGNPCPPNDDRSAPDDETSEVGILRARVLAFIGGQERGATCDEVEEALETLHETTSARFWELANMGGIENRDDATRPTRRGNPARVWHSTGNSIDGVPVPKRTMATLYLLCAADGSPLSAFKLKKGQCATQARSMAERRGLRLEAIDVSDAANDTALTRLVEQMSKVA